MAFVNGNVDLPETRENTSLLRLGIPLRGGRARSLYVTPPSPPPPPPPEFLRDSGAGAMVPTSPYFFCVCLFSLFCSQRELQSKHARRDSSSSSSEGELFKDL